MDAASVITIAIVSILIIAATVWLINGTRKRD
jgi:hypothetical protein